MKIPLPLISNYHFPKSASTYQIRLATKHTKKKCKHSDRCFSKYSMILPNIFQIVSNKFIGGKNYLSETQKREI